ncbi:class I SAM-dependent methyltransferase [Pampinifervens florentissimum]|uniref:class I SAM-dependent methyltransferase n=1 Tax=Pampinifervens florentissimum TaxID=1632019 RepID=UPI0013B48A79|nr:class I SAM-dependent methyltransferase [Hydrogenobacter sp. T-8]QID33804.1 class I SAM-dependent methyltransferase [Hydrogenobacter sp. T-8]
MRVFDLYADRYDRWYELPFGSSVYSLEVECLRRLYRPTRLSLEVGVGSGRFAKALGVRYGVDTSIELLRKARERGINVIQARAEGLPFKDKTFESLLMVVSICFFERPLEALLEAKRVLRKDGMLLLGLVLSDSPWARFYQQKAQQGHPLYSVARFYSFEEIKGMLSQAGFRLSRVATTLFDSPQDTKKVENTEIKEGYHPEGGFFCLMATP